MTQPWAILEGDAVARLRDLPAWYTDGRTVETVPQEQGRLW